MESVTVRLTFDEFTTLHGDRCSLSLLARDDGTATVYFEIMDRDGRDVEMHLSAEDWERLKAMVAEAEATLTRIEAAGSLRVAIADVAPYRKADVLKGLGLPKGRPLPPPLDEIFR